MLAKKIQIDYKPEAVLFIAKGSFEIGLELSKYFNIPLYEIEAKRKKNKLKLLISPLLIILPKKIKIILRKFEIKSGLHTGENSRNIILKDKSIYNYQNILLVDDSADTGKTLKEVSLYLKKNKINKIKIATFNKFIKSEELVEVDYFLYEDCMINGPWSKDSKYYREFIGEYNAWKKN